MNNLTDTELYHSYTHITLSLLPHYQGLVTPSTPRAATTPSSSKTTLLSPGATNAVSPSNNALATQGSGTLVKTPQGLVLQKPSPQQTALKSQITNNALNAVASQLGGVASQLPGRWRIEIMIWRLLIISVFHY